MVITAPNQARSGPRPINLNRDIPQVINLLELVFGERLGSHGHRLFSRTASKGQQPAFIWRLSPAASRLGQGYVWEEDGRIVGNATLLKTRMANRFLVVNVAVHPDYRRRGIARGLMNALIEQVKQRDGRYIILQVVKDNTAAIRLYQSLNFDTLGSMTSWRSSMSRLAAIEPTLDSSPEPPIRELPRHAWRLAYELDTHCLSPDLNWPEPLPPDVYKFSFWRRLNNFLNGRQAEVWVTANEANQLVGLVGIWSEWGHPHQVTLRVHPAWRGKLERPLLAKALRRLRYLPHRSIRIDHLENDSLVNQLLREANFQPRRTLTHMRLTLT